MQVIFVLDYNNVPNMHTHISVKSYSKRGRKCLYNSSKLKEIIGDSSPRHSV